MKAQNGLCSISDDVGEVSKLEKKTNSPQIYLVYATNSMNFIWKRCLMMYIFVLLFVIHGFRYSFLSKHLEI